MATVVAIVNQKGGVGKTTTSINLSASLAAAEKKVLLIDFDPQGHSGLGLGLDKEVYSACNIFHALIDENTQIQDAIYKTELDLLDVCPSDNNLAGAESELMVSIGREYKLKTAIEPIRDKYDFIVIDCPPGLGNLTVNAMTAADRAIIPMEAEFLSMDGLAQVLNTIDLLVKTKINPNLKMEGILLTMVDMRNNLSKQVAQEIRQHFKEEVFETFIPRNVKLSECPSFGKPIILYDIASKGCEAYLSLAKEFLTRTGDIQGQKKNKVNGMIPTLEKYEITTHTN